MEYVRPMSCKRRVAKVTGLPWAEGAEKNRRPGSRAPAMSWYRESGDQSFFAGSSKSGKTKCLSRLNWLKPMPDSGDRRPRRAAEKSRKVS